jgi:hypothetical protein
MMTGNMKTNTDSAHRTDFIRTVVDAYLTKREKTAGKPRLRETTVMVTDLQGEIPESEEKISERGPSTPSL